MAAKPGIASPESFTPGASVVKPDEASPAPAARHLSAARRANPSTSAGYGLCSAKMATSLVTGGAGFIGSHLCDYLLAKGHRVICVDNLDTGSLQNIEHIHDAEFVFRNHDLTEPLFLEEDMDFVFHLASPASPIDYLRLPLHTLKVGSYGTHHMLGLAKFKRARFLLASTSEVYGDPENDVQSESYWGNVNPIGPRGVYDEAKRYAEAMTMAYHRQQGVDTCVARIFNTYGPRMRAQDGRALTTFVAQAIEDKPLTVFGDGSQRRTFCYVDDLVRGLYLLATCDEHLPVNLGSSKEMTLLELANTVLRITGSKSEIIFEALPAGEPLVRCPDITRARQVLAWEPEFELEEGLRRLQAALAPAARARSLTASSSSDGPATTVARP
jgi:dTDP-glucose 4,6-dehydratase